MTGRALFAADSFVTRRFPVHNVNAHERTAYVTSEPLPFHGERGKVSVIEPNGRAGRASSIKGGSDD
jgi:hypothetical protein